MIFVVRICEKIFFYLTFSSIFIYFMIEYDNKIQIRDFIGIYHCIGGLYCMELKKCVRCGCFFSSDNVVCLNCESKDKKDVYRLNTYIENSPVGISAQDLSFGTGISLKNISRFIDNNNISIL